MLIVSNLGFYVYYKSKVLEDGKFGDWMRMWPTFEYMQPAMITCINLKTIRYSYSGFYSWETTSGRFADPERNIHRPLKMLTYFQYVFVYIPIWVADVFIVMEVPWGHQVLVLAIETFILQFVIIYLTYREFDDPDLYSPQDNDYLQLKPRTQR